MPDMTHDERDDAYAPDSHEAIAAMTLGDVLDAEVVAMVDPEVPCGDTVTDEEAAAYMAKLEADTAAEREAAELADMADALELCDDDPTAPRYERGIGFVIDTESKAVWAANKVLDAREQESRAKAAAKVVVADRVGRLAKLEKRFLPALKDFTLANLPYKKRSIATMAGVLALTAQGEKVTIDNAEALTVWAATNLPAIVESITTVKPFCMAEVAAVLGEHAPHLLETFDVLKGSIEKALIAYRNETGELPPGCTYREAGDSFTLRSPKAEA